MTQITPSADASATISDFDKLAEEYETGTWSGHGTIVMGRPKLFDEDMGTVSFRLPHSRITAIESATKQAGISKSEFFRLAVEHELAAMG